jgi:hypothetical protein
MFTSRVRGGVVVSSPLAARRSLMRLGTALAIAGALAMTATSVFAQCPATDDFEDATTQGWDEGASSPNPPFNTGPPGGRYLQNPASGSAGAGGRQVMFNRSQWATDLVSCNVASVRMKLMNNGANTLHVRVAVAGASTWWVSTNPFPLPNDSQWYAAGFGLDLTELTQASGTAPLATVLAGVTEFRILSAAAVDFRGDQIDSRLCVDDIRALSTPPNLVEAATWGLIKVRAERPTE